MDARGRERDAFEAENLEKYEVQDRVADGVEDPHREHDAAVLEGDVRARQHQQRTERRELQAFNDIADFYQAKHRLTTSIAHLAQIGGSSLTDDSIEVSRANLEAQEVPTSYVPFRNAHLLAIATSWAEVIGAGRIYIGAVAEDSSGYPDCRPEFYEAFERAISIGTRPETVISLVTPVIHLRKSEIIRRGLELGAPLELSWSCYKAEDQACGECDSCALRLRGFREAGVRDPIPYATAV